jgi:hypothetical protein
MIPARSVANRYLTTDRVNSMRPELGDGNGLVNWLVNWPNVIASCDRPRASVEIGSWWRGRF